MLGLLLVCALCSWARPDGALARSAARAFDNSVWLFSQGVEDEEVDEDDDLPWSPPRQRTPSPGTEHGVAPTAARRRRCSPFQAKRIAAAQGWRCACGCVGPSDPLRRGLLLDESFEIDHIRPLAAGGSNDESNLRALLRTHHQAISSAFARGPPSLCRHEDASVTLYASRIQQKLRDDAKTLLRTLSSHWKFPFGKLDRGWLALLDEGEYSGPLRPAMGSAARNKIGVRYMHRSGECGRGCRQRGKMFI